ncbi:hypothetical protein GCM10011351_17330 [Paraliobacillus quinghaiensis]|uniref:YqhG n=1 Tax=Paraliobacillus quinghaiensis TaxID=470815 RepID=A0A917TQ09_9BACI|nr:YqhG family protein [Paraliobacillus quinghaiensis]GGM31668.1 hypothetical protein GCM10011351_17330 [Paraliobacillus quinghaiensis]
MAIANLHDFLFTFFKANHCDILENRGDKLSIQLTDKMDEYLLNRPFYWQYVKKLGLQGEPGKITLLTNPLLDDEEGEPIHFGSPRLQQIFRLLDEEGKFVRLYQMVQVDQQTALVPWLVLNIKVSFIGKQKKEAIKSIGINMINGGMINNIIDQLEKIQWDTKIPDFCYNLSPLIRLKSSYQRIIQLIEKELQETEHDWAIESWRHMEEEKKLLDYFYQTDKKDYTALYKKESEAIEALYRPQIAISIINGGIFHMTQSTSLNQLLD